MTEQRWILILCVALCGVNAARADEKNKDNKNDPEPKKVASEADVKSAVRSLVWAGNRRVVLGSDDGVIRLWQPESGQVTKLGSHDTYVVALAASADGKTVVSADEKCIKVWDVGARKLVRTLSGSDEVGSIALSPDGKTLAAAKGHDREIVLWEMETGKSKGTFRISSFKGGVVSVAYSSDGKQLYLGVLVTLNEGSFWNEIEVLDAKTGKSQVVARAGSRGRDDQRRETRGHRFPLAVSRDGKQHVGATWNDGLLAVEKEAYRTAAKGVTGVAYVADGKTLAVGARDGSVRLVGSKKQKKADETPTDVAVVKEQGKVTTLAASPDGKGLAWGNEAGKVRFMLVAKVRKDHAVAQKQ